MCDIAEAVWYMYVHLRNTTSTYEGPRTRVGQPKMKYWKLHELHKNEVKSVHPI